MEKKFACHFQGYDLDNLYLPGFGFVDDMYLAAHSTIDAALMLAELRSALAEMGSLFNKLNSSGLGTNMCMKMDLFAMVLSLVVQRLLLPLAARSLVMDRNNALSNTELCRPGNASINGNTSLLAERPVLMPSLSSGIRRLALLSCGHLKLREVTTFV
jgi:hypothetical protein